MTITLNYCESYGQLAELLPIKCIEECREGSNQYRNCEKWVRMLDLNISRDQCIEELKDFDLWEDEELEDESDFDLNVKYLWVAAGYDV